MIKNSYSIKGSAGKPIAIDVTSSSQNSSLIVFVHGFKGFKDWGTHSLVAEYFAAGGFDFLKFNFSHNGISENGTDVFDDLHSFGDNTFSKELFDLDQVVTFALSGETLPIPSKLYLIGHSRGGGISIIEAACDKRISKLITWASIGNFRNLWKPEQEQQWRQEGVIYTSNARTKQDMPLHIGLLQDLEHHPERLDILASARKVEIPWLIIHGEADTSVAPAHAQELNRQRIESNLVMIRNADHVFGGKHPWTESSLPEQLKEACDKTIAFLQE